MVSSLQSDLGGFSYAVASTAIITAEQTVLEHIEESKKLPTYVRKALSDVMLSAGYHKTVVMRERKAPSLLHYRWLVRYPGLGHSLGKIASELTPDDPVGYAAIWKSIRHTATVMGLSLRPGKRGPKAHYREARAN